MLKALGEGGMGVVYLAQHAALGRLVAIKVLRNDLEDNPDAVQRFFLEARAVNQIRHPHIVEITDFYANEGGEAYYIMEFLEGLDCEELLRKDAIPLVRGLEIARQVASALGAVHDAGIVHRDLKSANVFVTTDADGNDWVKLLDFGIAKLNDAHGKRIGDTLEGIAAGTPEFVSPEQAMALEVDHRSDIYSFGIFLYHVATGQLPFTGESTNDILKQQVYEKPRSPRRVKRVGTRIPIALNALIMRCLAKNQKDRPQSMREIQPELALIADSVRYELQIKTRRLWRVGVAVLASITLFIGSAATDVAFGNTPGVTAWWWARSAGEAISYAAHTIRTELSRHDPPHDTSHDEKLTDPPPGG